jgi:hypothetical protein
MLSQIWMDRHHARSLHLQLLSSNHFLRRMTRPSSNTDFRPVDVNEKYIRSQPLAHNFLSPPRHTTSHALAVTSVAVKATLSLRSRVSWSQAPSLCFALHEGRSVFLDQIPMHFCQSDAPHTIFSLTVFDSRLSYSQRFSCCLLFQLVSGL